MGKLPALILLVGFLVLIPMGLVMAGPVGVFCWQKGEFDDIAKIAVFENFGNFLVHGTVAVTGRYVNPLTGNAILVPDTPTRVILAFTETHDGSSFGGATSLSVYATFPLDGPNALTGTALTTPLNGEAASIPIDHGWTFISCPP